MLIVDDDGDMRELLHRVLSTNGMESFSAVTAADGLRALFDQRPDLVVLDGALPDADGRHALERIRELTDVPVVMVASDDSEATKVGALRSGADDYVTKPFGRDEFVARLESLLRRSLPSGEERNAYADALVRINYGSLEVTVGGRPLDLTALELRLLLAFTERAGEVLSADQLLERVWGDSSLPRDRVKLYVAYLRDKFRCSGSECPIETVRGFGYRYRPPLT